MVTKPNVGEACWAWFLEVPGLKDCVARCAAARCSCGRVRGKPGIEEKKDVRKGETIKVRL